METATFVAAVSSKPWRKRQSIVRSEQRFF
jgi:hypothetical protein